MILLKKGRVRTSPWKLECRYLLGISGVIY